MRICVGSREPGGPDALLVGSLEESDILDYYDLHDDGSIENIAQTRKCMAGCSDMTESIARRGVEGVIAVSLSKPSTLFRLRTAGVRVFLADSTSVRDSLNLLHRRQLRELNIDGFSKVGRKRRESV